MAAYRNGYLTKGALTSQIKIAVAEEHGFQLKDIKIDWLVKWQVVKFPTGLVSKQVK